MSNLPEAHSREEILLKAIAESQAIDSPEPKSRVEIYLKQIMENGSISPEEIQAAVDAYLAEHPLDMDASLVDPLKAAPAGVVGERLSELKGDLVDLNKFDKLTALGVAKLNGGIIDLCHPTMKMAWTENKVITDINLIAGHSYSFSVKTDVEGAARYLALCNEGGTVLATFNQAYDGSFTYTPTEDMSGCYLDCRTSATGVDSKMEVSITLVSPKIVDGLATKESVDLIKDALIVFNRLPIEPIVGMYIHNSTLSPTVGKRIEFEAKNGDVFRVTSKTANGYYAIQSSVDGTSFNINNNYSCIKNFSTVWTDTANNTNYVEYSIEITEDCWIVVQNNTNTDFYVEKRNLSSIQKAFDYTDESSAKTLQEAKEYTDNKEANVEVPKINIGSKIYAVVGDTVQIFKKSIFDCLCDYIFEISCAKGKVYPRYWEYTPTASDVGTSVITFNIYKNSGEKVATKTVSLVTVNANNPSSQVNVMNIGDSTTYSGQTPIELSRRLKGTNGVATSPEPLALSNVNVNGRLKNADKSCGWEGTGGWTYSTYNGAGVTAVRFTVTNASNISVGDIIQINATNSKGYYRFQVEEVNVTSGSGELRCMFYQTPYTSTFLDEVSASGSLNNTSGSTVGTYSSLSVKTYQPFWNNETDSFDITSYVNAYLDGHCEYIFILLGINNLIGMNPFNDVTNIFNDCKTLLNNIHSQLPNTKILLSTNPLISQNGGVGANYNANTNSGSFDENGWNHKIWSMNDLYYTLESDDAYKDWVTVINTHAQFDSEYGYPYGQYPVNIRMNNVKENRGTNAVHPLNEGYWMIADAEFRALLGLLS